MRKIIFELIKEEGSNLIVYPDTKGFFKNTQAHPTDENLLVADYTGGLDFEDYVSKPYIYKTDSASVTLMDDTPLQGMGNIYYAATDTFIKVSTEIVDEEGNVQTQLDAAALGFPPVLQLPIIKVAKGVEQVSIDEIYFITTLVDGKMESVGKFPSSGNWKILTSRVNDSLVALNAQWRIERPTITFYVNEMPSA